jgi:Yip1 domain
MEEQIIEEQIIEEQIIEQPTMSEPATLASIFFEPGRTFESLRIKPKFLLSLLLTMVFSIGFMGAVSQKINISDFFIDQMKKSSQYEKMPTEQREPAIAFYKSSVFKGIFFGTIFIGIIVTTFVGGLIYWLAVNAMGGTTTYLRGVSVWAYSAFAPTLVATIANFIVLLLKSAEDIDTGAIFQRGGLIHANPTMFIDTSKTPVLNTLFTQIDLFQIWGIVLAAIGLKVVGKLSNGAAWGIVLILKLIVITASVAWVAILGNGS